MNEPDIKTQTPPYLGTVAVVALSLMAAFVHELAVTAVMAGGFSLMAWMYRKQPHHFLGILFTAFCVSPFLRRISDFHSGFNPGSLTLIAPYALFVIPLQACLSHLPQFRKTAMLPFAPVLMAFLGALLVGLMNNGPIGPLISVFEWGYGPAIFSYLMLAGRDQFELPKFMKWLAVLTLIEAGYALYQYVQPPPWDAYWLLSSGMITSMGRPLPFQMRVFGTLNSAGTFAIFMTLYLLTALRDRWFYLIGPLGIAAIAATMVRASWVTLALGWALLLAISHLSDKFKQASRLAAVFTIVGIMALPMADQLQKIAIRAMSLTDLKSDGSFNDRRQLLDYAKETILNTPLGFGLGSEGRASRFAQTGLGGIDNGLISITWVFGWMGAFLYLLGVFSFLILIFKNLNKLDSDAKCFATAALAFLASNAFGTALSDLSGVMTWLCLAMAYSAVNPLVPRTEDNLKPLIPVAS